MPNQDPALQHTFLALADPTRRAVVQRLSAGEATVSQLAAPYDMALPSFTQHLGVLERAGLITSRREGRSRVCALNPAALKQAENWMAAYRQQWESRLERMTAHVNMSGKEQSND